MHNETKYAVSIDGKERVLLSAPVSIRGNNETRFEIYDDARIFVGSVVVFGEHTVEVYKRSPVCSNCSPHGALLDG